MSVDPTSTPAPVKIALGVREAAAALCLSARTVEALAQRGELPSFRVGRRRLFSVAALERWTQQQQSEGGDE